MRPLALILILLASSAVLRAQEQESKVWDRILGPADRNKAFSIQSKAYYDGSGSVDLSKNANVKNYYVYQNFSLKSFDSKQYAAKNFWQGALNFITKPANVKADAAGKKVFATKAAPVKDAREAGKNFAANGKTFATRESPEKGKTSQNHLEEEIRGDKGATQMNIDEVRDLLNKPKL